MLASLLRAGKSGTEAWRYGVIILPFATETSGPEEGLTSVHASLAAVSK